MYSLSIGKVNSFHHLLHMFKIYTYKGIRQLNRPYWIITYFSAQILHRINVTSLIRTNSLIGTDLLISEHLCSD